MEKKFTKEFLKKVRNDISIKILIQNVLKLPCKNSDGFLCPICNGFHTSTLTRVNLGLCFDCNKNFIESIKIIEPLLERESKHISL